MRRFFQYPYSGAPFELFGPAHLWTVLLIAVLSAGYLYAGRRAGERTRGRMRAAIGITILAMEGGSNVWWAANNAWSMQEMLPLHMCSVMTLVMGIAFITNSRRAFTLIYFLGIGGAVQAVITPDAGEFGYPHFRFFDALLSHALLVLGGLWVVLAERVRPTFRAAVTTLAALNLYALVIFFVNAAIGSNYLFVNRKPGTASAIDLMPEWPWYILILEVLAMALFTLMYLPFHRAARNDRPVVEGDVSNG